MTSPSLPPMRRRSGFSFIEIMVAMTLLAMVIGSLGVLSARISERARLAELLAQRNYVVVQQMNRYNAINYDSLAKYSLSGTQDTIPSGMPQLRFIRRDTVYKVFKDSAWDSLRLEVKVVITPLDSIPGHSQYKDSILLRRRSPNLTSPLNCAGC